MTRGQGAAARARAFPQAATRVGSRAVLGGAHHSLDGVDARAAFPRSAAARRLQDACSGPRHLARFASSCPISHGSPGRIGSPHLQQRAAPAATATLSCERVPPSELCRQEKVEKLPVGRIAIPH